MRRGALPDFILTNKEGLVENVKLKGRLGCSDHEMVKFWIQRAARREHSKLATLDFVRTDFALFRDLLVQAVHEIILSNRFLVVRAKELRCGREESRRFYREHAGRFFYQRLVEFMASGPMWAYILAHENAITLWRTLMGPTKVFRARNSVPDSIRGAYGLTDTRNTTHGSDSPASASREIAFFFPEFNEELWYQQEEPHLRCGQVYYNAEERVHCVFKDEETELT
nr:nucleoside diphosphate kinase 6 [Anser cygnoides]